MNNYRSISVISVVAKVSERITYDQVYAYLSENNLIPDFTLFILRSLLY